MSDVNLVSVKIPSRDFVTKIKWKFEDPIGNTPHVSQKQKEKILQGGLESA